ncbi:MAG TPA: DNA-formamidopyrimidine glycosylase family protein [Candidatus Acidoferrales bacterium]|nr:DNA-formamidopyrimidine glycosylase family protein [Candidatus Acidoferrales bacterium]
MFEIPEYVTIAGQMAKSLTGKHIAGGSLGNSPHKFVWYNRKPREFEKIIKGKTVGKAYARGKWLFIPVEPGYILVFGECGGKILLHESASDLPDKYHLSLLFDDSTALSAATQMWGAMELYEKGKELERKYICGMRTTPLEPKFTVTYLTKLIEESMKVGGKSVKALLTQNQLIPGIGNSIAQDIMFVGRLHPKQPLEVLEKDQIRKLHGAIVQTLKGAIRLGGRNDEFDLYGNPGKYVRLMDKDAVGRPCLECGTKIKKIAYLGGVCYFCPKCQGES